MLRTVKWAPNRPKQLAAICHSLSPSHATSIDICIIELHVL